MARNVTALASALERRRETPPTPQERPPAYYSAPSRAGKLHISAWLSPDYKASLRAVQMQFPTRTLQDLFSEALNDLFTKYNAPVVRED